MRKTLVLLMAVLLLIPVVAMAQNNPPVADAGPHQNIYVTDSVVLHGTADDPDGDPILAWQWEVVSAPTGSTYDLAEADTSDPTFSTDTLGDYIITLSASDGSAWSELVATMVVAIEYQGGNSPPMVWTEPGGMMWLGDSIVLHGSADDPDGDPVLGWQWGIVTAPSGSSPLFTGTDTPEPSFTPDMEGSYSFSVIAWDGLAWSEPAVTTVGVDEYHATNDPPIVDAGPSQTVFLGDVACLHGTAEDPDGDEVILWEWEVISAPAGSTYGLMSADTADPVLSTDTLGDYVITLRAMDDRFEWSELDATLVTFVENQAPTAVVSASPLSGPAPLTVDFDGTGSSDPEGGELFYDWHFGDLSNGTGPTPTHEYEAVGIYIGRLMVTDDHGNIDFDTVEITVTADNGPCSGP